MKKGLVTLLAAGIMSCATTDAERLSRSYNSQTDKYNISVEEVVSGDICIERTIELNRLPGIRLNVMNEPLGVQHAYLRDRGCNWNIDQWNFNYREDRGINTSMFTEKVRQIYEAMMKEKQITEIAK